MNQSHCSIQKKLTFSPLLSSVFSRFKTLISSFLDNPLCKDGAVLLRFLIDCCRFRLAWKEVPSTIEILEYCFSNSFGFRSVNMQIQLKGINSQHQKYQAQILGKWLSSLVWFVMMQ